MITPWNFPMAIPSWKLSRRCRRATRASSSRPKNTPLSTYNLVQAAQSMPACPRGGQHRLRLWPRGWPPAGRASPCPRHQLYRVQRDRIAGRPARRLPRSSRVSLEMGRQKRARSRSNDANLELALDGALWGAFGTTGQRCTATSRHPAAKGPSRARFREKLVERAKKLKVGNDWMESIEVGRAGQRKPDRDIEDSECEIALADGAKLLCGGSPLTEGSYAKGLSSRRPY